MSVEFIGAHPRVALLRGDTVAGLVSLWEADWSVRGPGFAVLAWAEGDPAVRLLASEMSVGSWVAETFARHLDELSGLPAIAEPVECEVREWRVGPDHVRARVTGEDGSRVAVTISQPFAESVGQVAEEALGMARWARTSLLRFCAEATIEIDEARVLGRALVDDDPERPSSTAIISTHDTWTRL